MAKKFPDTAHVRVTSVLRERADKRISKLNKANKDEEQKWDLSKYIRWLIRRDLKGEFGEPSISQVVLQDNQEGDNGCYDDLLNITRR